MSGSASSIEDSTAPRVPSTIAMTRGRTSNPPRNAYITDCINRASRMGIIIYLGNPSWNQTPFGAALTACQCRDSQQIPSLRGYTCPNVRDYCASLRDRLEVEKRLGIVCLHHVRPRQSRPLAQAWCCREGARIACDRDVGEECVRHL